MRTVSALEVRKKFGQLIDEAAAGERLIIERAGQPIAALVPLSDLPEDREGRVRRRREAVAQIMRMGRSQPGDLGIDSATLIRQQRRERDAQITRAVRGSTGEDPK
jgi:prevent-host-death family protein